MQRTESVKFSESSRPEVASGSLAGNRTGMNDSWSMLKPLLKRYWPILAITWTVHLGLGLSMSVIGVTLPYLALNTGETLASASILFTARSVVVCATSLSVGLVVSRLPASRSKLLLLLGGSLLNAASILMIPFAKSLAVLILAQCLFGVGLGTLETVDNMLVIYLFGPVMSRSLSHSLHFCIGIGAFLAPLLARPFLIQMGDIASNAGEVCRGGSDVNVTNSSLQAPPVDLEPLKWPYIVTGCLHSLWILGYIVLLLRNFQLTKFSAWSTNAAASEPLALQSGSQHGDTRIRRVVVVILFVLFFVLHVGQENVFWSHLYAFGVCSPRLRMSPSGASLLSTVFFVGFIVSRGLGIVAARFLPPARILIVQLIGCLLSTGMLAIWGEVNSLVVYIACGLYGFCIAMVFPTGITWLASKMDVTGPLSSAWFFGAYVGLSTYPLAAGQLFLTSVGAISIMYLAVATSAACIAIVTVMFIIAK